MLGVIERGHVVRCGRCPRQHTMRPAPRQTLRQAEAIARAGGWSKTVVHGWTCPNCTLHRNDRRP